MNELNATRLPHRRRVIRQWRECPGQQGGVAGVNNNLTKSHHPQHLTSGLLLFDLGKPIFVFRQWAAEGDIQTINHANVMTDSQRVIHYLRAVFRHLVATGDKLFSQRPENNFPALFSHVTPGVRERVAERYY